MGILKNTLTAVANTAVAKSFMEGYSYTPEEAGFDEAREAINKKTVLIGRCRVTIGEALASYSKWIPGKPRRVIRGCRRVVGDLLKRKGTRD